MSKPAKMGPSHRITRAAGTYSATQVLQTSPTGNQTSERSFSNNPSVSRRDFLKVFGVNLAGLLLPIKLPEGEEPEARWPDVNIEDLPAEVRNILEKTPRLQIDSTGFLSAKSPGQIPVEILVAATEWNQQHNQTHYRLTADRPWGIVLHWYGDKENFDRSLKGYLRGFNSFRRIEDYTVQTSAHFLIGDEPPLSGPEQLSDGIGIIQTQSPDTDGTPLVASHLRNLDYVGQRDKKQYFVRACYELTSRDANFHSLLQDLFDGPREDPNRRTLAIEIAGFNFDQPEYYPGDQKIANVLATVWAIMRRYHIPASNLLGHHELQLGKADPGKKFMATIRFLLGVKALAEADPLMDNLIFGQYLIGSLDKKLAVDRYFRCVHEYATLVGSRRSIYEWEIQSKYWLVMQAIDQHKNIRLAASLRPPLSTSAHQDGNAFLAPHSHEGVDLYLRKTNASANLSPSFPVLLIGDGLCLYQGSTSQCGQGSTSIFRHYGADGSDILSIYEQVNERADLKPGQYYPKGFPLGKIKARQVYQAPYLHFAIAYGSIWEMDLKSLGHPPLNAGQGWISERYLDPMIYLANRSD